MGILVSLAPCLLFPIGLYLEDERDASPHLLVLIGVFFLLMCIMRGPTFFWNHWVVYAPSRDYRVAGSRQ